MKKEKKNRIHNNTVRYYSKRILGDCFWLHFGVANNPTSASYKPSMLGFVLR
jgi:hypothetical protein